jgi:hypothetical protein
MKPGFQRFFSEARIGFGFGLNRNGMTKIGRRSEWHAKSWRQLPWRFSSIMDGDLAIEYVANSCKIQTVGLPLFFFELFSAVIIKP